VFSHPLSMEYSIALWILSISPRFLDLILRLCFTTKRLPQADPYPPFFRTPPLSLSWSHWFLDLFPSMVVRKSATPPHFSLVSPCFVSLSWIFLPPQVITPRLPPSLGLATPPFVCILQFLSVFPRCRQPSRDFYPRVRDTPPFLFW